VINFSIRMVPGAGALVNALNRYSGDLRSVADPLRDARDNVVIPSIEERFDSRTGADGRGWPKWADETPFMPYHQMYGPGQNLLHVTGSLRRRATQKGIWEIKGQQGEAFVPMSALPSHAPVLNFGGPNRGLRGGLSDIPPRPFMEIGDSEMSAIGNIFADFMVQKFGARVGRRGEVETIVGDF